VGFLILHPACRWTMGKSLLYGGVSGLLSGIVLGLALAFPWAMHSYQSEKPLTH
jgi:hypothetical protein